MKVAKLLLLKPGANPEYVRSTTDCDELLGRRGVCLPRRRTDPPQDPGGEPLVPGEGQRRERPVRLEHLPRHTGAERRVLGRTRCDDGCEVLEERCKKRAELLDAKE